MIMKDRANFAASPNNIWPALIMTMVSLNLSEAGMYALQAGIDLLRAWDYDGRTPLHLAASEGAFVMTEWLLSQDVDVNAVDRFGRTPLMDAFVGQHVSIATILTEVRVISVHVISGIISAPLAA
jgi:hypothetical protein